MRYALARYGTPEIFNTDQGSQFTGFAFTARPREAGIRPLLPCVLLGFFPVLILTYLRQGRGHEAGGDRNNPEPTHKNDEREQFPA